MSARQLPFLVFGVVCGALLIAWSAPASAQSEGGGGVVQERPDSTFPEETYETTRGLGMGLGGRAGAISTSALAYNTANLAMAPLYHIEATSGFWAGEGAWTIGTSVVDSVTSKLAMGTNFRGVFDGGTRQYKGWDWRAGIGIALAKSIMVGTAVRYAQLKAQSKAGVKQGPELKALTMDASLTIVPHDKIRVSGLSYNLIDTKSVLAPRIVGGGVSVLATQGLDLAFDFLVDLDTFDAAEYLMGGGIEYLIKNSVVIRGGYKRDTGRDNHQVGGSFGYMGKSFSMEAAAQHTLDGSNSETRLLFSVRYHVH